ncbi:MAG: tRNA (cytidine(34)-2'-O)-methyltransferase [Mariprofundaceae bacterium]
MARLCACTNCQLHLIHPLGFELDDRRLRRAGLDYWPYLNVREHANWQKARDYLGGYRRWFALSTKGENSLWDARFQPGDVLVFGSETTGLPPEIREELVDIRIPLRQEVPVRSLNLSTATGIAVYEALRQCEPADFK